MFTVTERQKVWQVGGDRRTRERFGGGLPQGGTTGTPAGSAPQKAVSIRSALSLDPVVFLSQHRQENGE